MPYIYFDRGSNHVSMAGFIAMAFSSEFERERSGSSNSGGRQTDSCGYSFPSKAGHLYFTDKTFVAAIT